MARPNVSKNRVLELIRDLPESNVYEIKYALGYSEPTVRDAIKRLVEEQKIKVVSSSRPYTYEIID